MLSGRWSPAADDLSDVPRRAFRARSWIRTLSMASVLLVGLACGRPSVPTSTEVVPEANSAACDSTQLREQVNAANEARAKHPTWFGDLTVERTLGSSLATNAILAACPRAREVLEYHMRALAMLESDEPAASVGTPPAGYADATARWRDEVCVDPTVFVDSEIDPIQRSSAVRSRCQLDDVGLGDSTSLLYARTGLQAFTLYRFLVDDGVEPGLASDAVHLFAYPRVDDPGRLPVAGQSSPFQEGLLLRLSSADVELAPGQRLSLRDGFVSAPAELESTLATRFEETFKPLGEAPTVVVQSDATAPATALSSILEAAGGAEVFVLVSAPGGDLGAERITHWNDGTPTTHVLRVEGGRYALRSNGAEQALVADALEHGFVALGQWAKSLPDQPPPVVAIEPSGLTVQQLVDLQLELQGRTCDRLALMVDDVVPDGCHPTQAVLLPPAR
jgi:hypothetical protein